MIIIPIKWLFHWEYTLFSDKPICRQSSRIGPWKKSSFPNPGSCSSPWPEAVGRPPGSEASPATRGSLKIPWEVAKNLGEKLETPWRRWTKCGKRWKSLGWTSGSQKKYLSIEILWVNRLVVSLPEKIVTVSLFRAWSKRRPEKIVSWDHHPRMEKSTYFEPPTSKIDINILIPGVTSRKYSSTCVWDIHGVNMYTYIYIYIVWGNFS